MKKMKVNIIRSESWLDDNFENICSILDETIKDFVDDDERIINIESSGLSRFWIYTTKD
jgi:hypothetical protein